MAIDSNIALGVKPIQIDSPLNSLAQLYQLKNAQSQGQMNDLNMQEKTRGIEDSNKLRNLYAQPGFDMNSSDSMRQVMAISPSQGIAMQKSQLDNRKTQGEIDKTSFDTASKSHSIYQNTLGSLAYSANLTKDAVMREGQGLVQSGVLKPEVLQAQLAGLSDDPIALKAQLLQGVHAQLTPEQLITAFAPKPTQMDNGQSVSFRDTNPNSPTYGQMTGGAPMQKMQSPESIASNASAAAGRAQSAQQFAVTQAGGKTPPGYRSNPDGSLTAIPGGPADLKINAEAVKKVADAKDVLGLLDLVDTLLPKATGGFIGTGVDLAASAFGQSTPGSLATAQLKAVQGALVAKMPKMSGPQSDKDVLLYREMAGQVGDPTLPVPQRQAAANIVRELHEKYAGMDKGSSIKPPATTTSTTSSQSYSNAEKEARYQAFKAGK
jgi:hypothetical protein